jgi:hypothetical protein
VLIEDDFLIDEHIPYESVDLGTPDYSGGIPAKEAFSVGRVFQWGLSLLQEQPILILLAGFNLFLVTFIPQLVSLPVDIVLEVAAASGELGEVEKELLSGLVSFAVQIVAFPLQQLVVAGAYIGIAQYIRSDEVQISRLYTSVRPAVNGMLYGLTVLAVNLLLVLVLWGPGIGIGAFLIAQGSWMVGALVLVLGVLLPLPVVVYVGLGLFLGIFAAVLDNRLPVDAMRISWRLARGTRLTLLVTQIALGLLGLIGACFCLFPAIIVNGMILGGYTCAWLHVSRSREVVDKWDFNEREAE